jgi:hypothetical protein
MTAFTFLGSSNGTTLETVPPSNPLRIEAAIVRPGEPAATMITVSHDGAIKTFRTPFISYQECEKLMDPKSNTTVNFIKLQGQRSLDFRSNVLASKPLRDILIPA